MHTGKSRSWLAGVSVLLGAQVLTVTGCRQTCDHCAGGTCAASGSPSGTTRWTGGGASTLPAPAAGAYGGQRTCPVTGVDLATAGTPLAVNVRGETVYVCCQNCARKVQQDPEPYLARVRAERAGGAPGLPAASGAATALPLGGQKTCPVTGEPLDPSAAVAVNVRGQTVYVCCRSCAAKVRRDPDQYLAKVLAERAALVGSRP